MINLYITIKSIKKTLGKYIEFTDLYIGIPLLMTFLILFAFINLSKKNRMYKIMILLIYYLFKNKNYCYFKEEVKER